MCACELDSFFAFFALDSISMIAVVITSHHHVSGQHFHLDMFQIVWFHVLELYLWSRRGPNKTYLTNHNKNKKEKYKSWQKSGTIDVYAAYVIASRAAKNAVSQAKQRALHDKLYKNNNNCKFYCLTRARAAAREIHFRKVKNRPGKLLVTNFEIFEQIQKEFEKSHCLNPTIPLCPLLASA